MEISPNINPTFPSLPTLWERPSLTVFVFGSLFDASVLVVLRHLWQLRTFNRNQPSRMDSWKKLENSPILSKMYPCLFHEHPTSSSIIQATGGPEALRFTLRRPDDRNISNLKLQHLLQQPCFMQRFGIIQLKWLFQVQIYKYKIAFMDSNWSFSTQRKKDGVFLSQSFMLHPRQFYCVVPVAPAELAFDFAFWIFAWQSQRGKIKS